MNNFDPGKYLNKFQKKRNFRKNLADFIKKNRINETMFLSIAAIIIGIVTGYVGIGMVKLLNYFHETYWIEIVANFHTYDTIYKLQLLSIPIIGALLSGIIIHYLSPEAEGMGIPEIIEAVSTLGGIIRARVIALKTISSILNIISGITLGRAGTLSQIGAAVGSVIGSIFKLSGHKIRVLIACGTASGVACIFNAPIAGVMFSLEIILGSFTAVSISPVLLSALTTSIIARYYLGNQNFLENIIFSMPKMSDYPFFIILGIICGLTAVIYIYLNHNAYKLFNKIPVKKFLKPACGALIIAGVAYFYPKIFDIESNIMTPLIRAKIIIPEMQILILLKLVTLVIGIGSGGSGGILTPILIIGALIGSTTGKYFYYSAYSELISFSGIYALIGMAAFTTGVIHAPITAIILIYELTNNHLFLIPVTLVTFISLIISKLFYKDSIFYHKLIAKNIKLKNGMVENILDNIFVKDIMLKKVHILNHSMDIETIVKSISKNNHNAFPVVNDKEEFIGNILMQDIRTIIFDKDNEEILPVILAYDIARSETFVLKENDTLGRAFYLFALRGMDYLPVVDNKNNKKLVGIISKNYCEIKYEKELLKFYLDRKYSC
jgi:chloride channel protein, CIC family